MPYKSHAQQKYFHYLESKGKMPKKTVKEFDDSTEYGDIPDKMHNYAYGGMVDDNPDEEMGEMDEFDSSGEPDTDGLMEDEQPMEYMSRGGRVKRMSRGGMAGRSGFAKALRKMY